MYYGCFIFMFFMLFFPWSKARHSSEQTYIIILLLNNKTKALFIFKWWHFFRTFWHSLQFECVCVRFLGVGLVCRLYSLRPPRGLLSTLILPSSLSLSIWRLIGWFCSDLPGQECTYLLMHFYVQANWQWRVPSFCSINISFPIWMQIWGVTPRIQMGCLSPWKITETLCEYDLCEL